MTKYLVLSGGGAAGAFQAGAIYALADAGYNPDYIAGSSIGALNGATLALRGAEEVRRVWEDVACRPAHYIRSAFLHHSGRLTPLRALAHPAEVWRLLRRKLPGLVYAPGVAAYVGALPEPDGGPACEVVYVDALSGDAHTHMVGSPDWRAAIMASAAYPGIFAPVEVGDRLALDGGLRQSVPLDRIIAQAVPGDEITVITTQPSDVRATAPRDWLDTAGIAYRILGHEAHLEDISRSSGLRGVTMRVIRPTGPINMFNFTRQAILAGILQGYGHATSPQ